MCGTSGSSCITPSAACCASPAGTTGCPGPFPTCTLVKEGGKFAPYFYLQFFHHSVGVSVGFVSVLYFAHLPDHQWFGFVLMGGPFVAIVPGMLANLVPPEYYKVHVVDKFIQWAVFVVYQ